MAKVRITVLKRMLNQDLADKYSPSGTALCSRFAEGQEFILDGLTKPEGFCDWAWDDIQKDYLVLLFGGSFRRWMKADNNIIACCTDGIRPVVFNLERIED